MSWASICPFMILYILQMDIVFIVNGTIFETIAFFLLFCGIKKCIDKSYEVLFHMKPHEVAGFAQAKPGLTGIPAFSPSSPSGVRPMRDVAPAKEGGMDVDEGSGARGLPGSRPRNGL